MVTFLVAYIALTQQSPSLFQQTIPQPTGRNGYEEYVMACDLVRNSGAATLTTATPEQFEDVIRRYEAKPDEGTSQELLERWDDYKPSVKQYQEAKKYRGYTILQLRQEALKLSGRALDLLHRGNQKPVFDPRTKMGMDTLFPEYAWMRGVGRVAVAGAYVAFAEGRTKQGTQYLCDAMILGQNLTDGVLISRLVGISVQALALAAFEKHLPNMAMPDALMMEDLAPRLILNPPAAVRSLEREFAFMASGIEVVFDHQDNFIDFSGTGQTQESAQAYIAKMTPADKRQVTDLAKRKLSRLRETTLAIYRQPEATWTDGYMDTQEVEQANVQIRSNNDLADLLVENFAPMFSQIGTAEVRNRTQIRLLALAGSVIRFRWENDRWPSSLVEAVGERGVFDPANGGKFQYEVQGNGFRVYSEGTKTTGEIALRYRRQPTGSNDPTPP